MTVDELENTALYVKKFGARLELRANTLWVVDSFDQLVYMNRASEPTRRPR